MEMLVWKVGMENGGGRLDEVQCNWSYTAAVVSNLYKSVTKTR